MSSLPDKPSALIRLALDDLAKCEQDPRYTINMCAWHFPHGDGNCSVCLAGAVMAQHLNISVQEERFPSSFDDFELNRKLRALNAFRAGWITGGLDHLGITIPENLIGSMTVESYRYDADQFYTDMRHMANILEKEGL